MSNTFYPTGMHFVALPATTTVYDFPLPATLLITGGHFYAKNAMCGDYINACIIDKDGVVNAKVTPDNPLVLSTFVNNWFVVPDLVINASGLTLPNQALQGLYLRVSYTSVADIQSGANVDVIVNLQSYKVT